MRASFFYIILIVAGLQIGFAREGKSQDLETTKITVGLNNEPLTVLFDRIERESKFLFAFSGEQVSKAGNLTLDKKSRTVKELLDLAFANTTLRYRQSNRSIVVWEESNDDQQQTSSLVFPVTGVVKDKNGNPVPGVSVMVKGTNRGAVTDGDGNYTIDINEGETLVFSFVGYKTVEEVVNGRTSIDVVFEEDTSVLQEVQVNAGYWKVDEREQTGNISRITAKDIATQPVSSPLHALIGRMPGVYVQQLSGAAGGGFNIQIRGINSLRADGNYPLYIVDGVPFPSVPMGSGNADLVTQRGNPLNTINPASIESIEVLKDADATAIYGSRGANGVVLITTKKGRAGNKTTFDINAYQGVGKVTTIMDLLSPKQYFQMRHEAFGNDGQQPGDINNDYDLLNWDTTRVTDWQKKLIGGTANFTNVQGSVSGGNVNTQFLLGFGFYRETTVLPLDFVDKKYSTRFSVNHTSNDKKFNVTFSSSFLLDNNLLPWYDPTRDAVTLAPNAPAVYDSTGKLNWENNTWTNPYAMLSQKFVSKSNTLVINALPSYEVLPGLVFKTNLGYTRLEVKENQQIPINSQRPNAGTTGAAVFSTNNVETWIVEPQLSFTRNLFGGKITSLIGGTFQQSTTNDESFIGVGYTSDKLLSNLKSASTIYYGGYNNALYRYGAVFARINYDWKSKYFINLTGRRDGSSRFGADQQFANFGAIGAAWIFSNEDVIKNTLSFLSFGKVRGSYGVTGSDQIPNYAFYALWSPTAYPYLGQATLAPANLQNPDFAWETNRKLEFALELGFLDNRIFTSASFYRNRSSNQLIGLSLPATAGYTTVTANRPAEVENKGIELELRTVNIQRNEVTWTTSVNFTVPRNKLIAYPELETSSYRYQYDIGKPLTIYKSYHWTGVDPQTGLYTYKDVNDNGIPFEDADWVGVKKIAQQYYGGLANSIHYKRFDLDVFFQFVKQTGSNYRTVFYNSPGTMGNQPDIVMTRWQQPGDRSNIERFTQDTGDAYEANSVQSDLVISDASFIRLKNVSLSYSIPGSEKLKVQNCRIYVQGQNLLTFTKYIGLDPEQAAVGSLPPLRVLTLGVQVTF